MSPRLRKLALTVHVSASVGWLGAVAGVLALAVAGLTSDDPQTVRAVYIAMEATGWFLLVPLAIASLVTGVVQSLGTRWGLFRHYWVVFKLLINVFATIILLMYMQTLGSLADMAAATSGDHLGGLRSPSPLLHSAVALVLLLVATTLAIYKPPGMTRYGRRRAREARTTS
jgi:DMSO/TMAO reductase YedYZ heme-binding membrane subunit